MSDGHPNVMKAIIEFEELVEELKTGVTIKRWDAIRKTAVGCGDLMACSYLVADTEHPTWKRLDALVGEVLVLTGRIYPNAPLGGKTAELNGVRSWRSGAGEVMLRIV